jgi:sterol desaturase/sphingolipid hydroxylase (fatty acid hydroxylase superfamily)
LVFTLEDLFQILTDFGLYLQTYFTSLSADFLNHKKRIFIGYLAISMVMAIVFLCAWRGFGARGAFSKVFDKKIFWSGSAKADYLIYAINRIISIIISPYLIAQSAVTTFLFFQLSKQNAIGFLSLDHWPSLFIITLYTLTYFFIDDLSKYIVHRSMHRWQFLWAFHKVHHSAETMTPITVYRVHPLESIIYGLRGSFVIGAVIGIFAYCFGINNFSLATLLGVNLFSFIFNVAGANLRHSHIEIAYWPWLEKIFISPAQHQLHHSIEINTLIKTMEQCLRLGLAFWLTPFF